jgi:hypothetical protein
MEAMTKHLEPIMADCRRRIDAAQRAGQDVEVVAWVDGASSTWIVPAASIAVEDGSVRLQDEGETVVLDLAACAILPTVVAIDDAHDRMREALAPCGGADASRPSTYVLKRSNRTDEIPASEIQICSSGLFPDHAVGATWDEVERVGRSGSVATITIRG